MNALQYNIVNKNKILLGTLMTLSTERIGAQDLNWGVGKMMSSKKKKDFQTLKMKWW